MKFLFSLSLAAALILAGCAGKSADAPSAAPVQRRIGDANNSVTSAQAHSSNAAGKIGQADADAASLDDKVVRLLN